MTRVMDLAPEPAARLTYPVHPCGLRGVDHVAMPARDVERAAAFYVQLLGAKVWAALGWSDEDLRLGRAKHVFFHVGETVLQVGWPHDGSTFADPGDAYSVRHCALALPARQLVSLGDALERQGVPLARPADAVGSVYLQDPEGNHLELVPAEKYAGRGTSLSWEGAGVPWPRLAHEWRPAHEARITRGVLPEPGSRLRAPANPWGIAGVDHVALNSRDPLAAAAFYQQVLGGALFAVQGYGTADAATAGAGKLVSVHLGRTIVQLGYPADGRSFAFAEMGNLSTWPHVAFAVSWESMQALLRRFDANGVPFSGPWGHRGTDGKSVYFYDADGNKLELVTRDTLPPERVKIEWIDGHADWRALAHAWRPAAAA